MTEHEPVELVRLGPDVLDALLAGDLDAAAASSGAPLTPWFLDERWLWEIRVEQLRRDPGAADWIARAALVEGVVVGHVGFHGPPDARGTVEVAYAVDPAHRRRGHATRLLRTALEWAEALPGVRTVRASISPDNVGSARTIAPFGFVQVDEQWDEDDGLETIYELPV